LQENPSVGSKAIREGESQIHRHKAIISPCMLLKQKKSASHVAGRGADGYDASPSPTKTQGLRMIYLLYFSHL